MDKRHAKFILQSYQPGTDLPPDALTMEALEQVENDQELRAWFLADQAQDAMCRQKLADVPIPSDLRARVLAAQPVAASSARSFSWHPRLALAATIAFLLGMVWFQPFSRSRSEFARYRLQIIDTLYRPLTFEFASVQPAELQAWVATHGLLGPVKIPPSLASLPGRGCRTLNYNGRPAVVICFMTSAETAVHLFVLSGKGIDHRLTEIAQIAAVGAFQTASWAEGDLLYVLTGTGDRESLQRLLPNGAVALTLPGFGIYADDRGPESTQCKPGPWVQPKA
ncbi:MAG TPA: hypothetical protein VK633_10555 [Verrucomicrobiae bacterium]|nr:hypothetical protein [Verrucomicrobiae bacterium]